MAVTEAAVREALRQVVDPELGINIVDLGLVYSVELDDARARVVMTMTSPACPLGGYIEDLVRASLAPLHSRVDVDIVWSPPWNPEMMSADARRQLDGGF